ncbi:MAG: hypothetical protein ABR929_02475 [Roseiarcus sp.]|jgi:hypothetical protein
MSRIDEAAGSNPHGSRAPWEKEEEKVEKNMGSFSTALALVSGALALLAPSTVDAQAETIGRTARGDNIPCLGAPTLGAGGFVVACTLAQERNFINRYAKGPDLSFWCAKNTQVAIDAVGNVNACTVPQERNFINHYAKRPDLSFWCAKNTPIAIDAVGNVTACTMPQDRNFINHYADKPDLSFWCAKNTPITIDAVGNVTCAGGAAATPTNTPAPPTPASSSWVWVYAGIDDCRPQQHIARGVAPPVPVMCRPEEGFRTAVCYDGKDFVYKGVAGAGAFCDYVDTPVEKCHDHGPNLGRVYGCQSANTYHSPSPPSPSVTPPPATPAPPQPTPTPAPTNPGSVEDPVADVTWNVEGGQWRFHGNGQVDGLVNGKVVWSGRWTRLAHYVYKYEFSYQGKDNVTWIRFSDPQNTEHATELTGYPSADMTSPDRHGQKARSP